MNLFEIYDTKSESIIYYFLFFGLIYIILSANNKKEETSQYNFLISFGSTILFSFFYSYICLHPDFF